MSSPSESSNFINRVSVDAFIEAVNESQREEARREYCLSLQDEITRFTWVGRIFAVVLALQAVCAFWFFVFGLGTVSSVLWAPVMWFAVSSTILGPVLLFFSVLFFLGVRQRRRWLEEA